MKTINIGISVKNAAPALQSSSWPDYVEESFDRLVAAITAIASAATENAAGSDI